MTDSKEVKDSLAQFLQTMHWDAFFTSTFRSHQRYSGTAMDLVANRLLVPRLRPTKMFIAAEQHLLGGWHCHGLLEFPQTHHSDMLVGFQKANLTPLGFNKVNMVSSLDACSVYLSKYLVKDDWHGDWRMIGRKKFWQPVKGGKLWS